MAEIIAPEGSPLSVAVISVTDMERSLHFYRDQIGLTARDPAVWSGEPFERLWHIPKDTTATAVFCELPGCPAGRVLLLDFDAADRKPIRPDDAARAYGLVNLNFYTDDIRADVPKFKADGFRFWSDPTFYEMSRSQGAPTEVIFDGPDTVAINLVELTGDDPSTRVGQMRAYAQKNGRTPTGYTPVVTTSHCARDLNRAVAFYTEVLKCGILIDEVLGSPEQNTFLNLPEDAKTAVKFMQGNHMFGKTALSQPLNYECRDLVPDAVAPNIGYLAQAFEVQDLAAAEAACSTVGAKTYTPASVYDIPGLGTVKAMIVRNPGSGALQLLYEA